MANPKKKFKFTDLSDDIDEIEQQPVNNFNDNINSFRDLQQQNHVQKNEQINLLKEDAISEMNKLDDVDVNKQTNDYLINDIPPSKLNNVSLDDVVSKKTISNDEQKSIDEKTKITEEKEVIQESVNQYQSKYDIDIDYDSDVPIKEQIEKQQKQKHQTFNEVVQQNKEKSIIEEKKDKKFNDDKIQQFFTAKEKLDVKTNIYLKPHLVDQILALSKKVGESRSAIINKLLEFALKEIGDK